MGVNKPKVNIHHSVLFLAQQAGLEVDTICEYIGLDKVFLTEKSETMNTDQIIKFWDMCNNLLNHERPGLKLAEATTITYVGVIGELMSKLNNLMQMIHVTCQVRNTITEMVHFEYEENETEVTLHVCPQKIWQQIDLESSISASEYTMGTFLQIMNQLVPTPITIIEVCTIRSKNAKIEYYQNYFNSEVKFGDVFYIKFKKEDLHQEISTRNKLLRSHYLDLCKEQQLDETEGNTFKSQLEHILFYNRWPNIPSGQEMASYLFISYKTLQRTLRKENISYRELVNQTKSKYALNMIRSGKFKAIEISEILKYSDLSSFSRAFKEYHGITIQEVKRLD